jgi:outer membrane murein-binding lipoprotein Lpp
MGVSTAVDKQMAADTKLAENIAHQQSLMDTSMKPFVETFDPFVLKFYEDNKWNGHKVIGRGFRHDVQSQTTFSLEQISTLIQETAKDLLAGNVGAFINAPSEDVKAAGKSAANVSLDGTDFIVSAVVATISSVLGLFTVHSEGQVSQGMESHRIAPGMTLHAYGYSATAAASGVTEHASLLLSGIGYQLVWCVEQQKMEQDMTFMAFISKQLAKLEASLDTMRDKLDAMEEDDDTDDDKIEHYKRRLTDLENTMDNFRAKADALVKAFSAGKVLAA